MFCKRCGSKLVDGAVFCGNCGAKQTAAAPAPAHAPTPTPAPAPAFTENHDSELEKTIGLFDAVPDMQTGQGTTQRQSQQPVQRPAYQAPAQQPVQRPAYQAPAQQPVQRPVYQAPAQQPVQRPVYQTPAQQPVRADAAYNPNAHKASNGKVGFGEAVALYFKNYVNFTGRASKSEYWWATLFFVVVTVGISFLSSLLPPLGGLCGIAFVIPQISLSVRRLHDVGRSGAYFLLGLIPVIGFFVLLVCYIEDSGGDNQWGPGPAGAGMGFADVPVNPAPSAPRVVTDDDVCAMARSHEPVNLNTPDAKRTMDSALGRIIPTYTGIENLAGAMMLCDPQSIKAGIAASDTDTLLIIFKALGFYMGQGVDAGVLGVVQRNVLDTLKKRI